MRAYAQPITGNFALFLLLFAGEPPPSPPGSGDMNGRQDSHVFLIHLESVAMATCAQPGTGRVAFSQLTVSSLERQNQA